jgi:hypothetical protein
MKFHRIACGAFAIASLVASAPQAFAAQVFASSYDIANGSGVANGGGNNYWDVNYSGLGSTRIDASALRIGVGDLTDGFIATDTWINVENLAGTGPYIGWYAGSTLDPVLTFNFAESTTISGISIFVDNSGIGGVLAPSRILIDGVERAFTAPAFGTVGSINFTGLNLSGGSHTIQLTHQNGSWLFLSEIQFVGISAVPESSTWAMMLLGFGAMGGAMRYRRQRTTVSFN